MSSDVDESGPEPDENVFVMTTGPPLQSNNEAMLAQGPHAAGDVSSQHGADGAEDDEDENVDDYQDGSHHLMDPAAVGLKEISNLGRFTVSSCKPSCGVEALRSDDLKLFWQSDGPQPHKLTVYFVKRVGIRDIRFYVDFNEDESYTPTKIVFRSGTSENSLIDFATMILECPVGWQQVPIAGTGGEPDGNTLVSYVLQMQILENHQNGKDTHLRGIRIYAFDADAAPALRMGVSENLSDLSFSEEGTRGNVRGDKLGGFARTLAAARLEAGDTGLAIPDFMKEPDLR